MIIEKRYQLAHSELATLEIGPYLEIENVEAAEITVVFLHGWLDNAGSFTTLLKACQPLLPQAHFVAVDLPGHGLSSHRGADNYYQFHDYLDDIYQLIKELAPKKLVLVGHSLGAMLASFYSAAFAQDVAALVQIEGFGPIAESPNDTVKRLRNGILHRQRLREKRERYFYSLDEMVQLRANINHLSSMQVMPIVKRGTISEGDTWRWRHDQNLPAESLYRMSKKHAAAVLTEIYCPHLVILGEQGYAHLLQQAEKESQHAVASLNDQFSISYLTGGHHCHMEHPQATAELIVGLVNNIEIKA